LARSRRDRTSPPSGDPPGDPPGPIGPAPIGPRSVERAAYAHGETRRRRSLAGTALLLAWLALIALVGAAAVYVYWPTLEPLTSELLSGEPAETDDDAERAREVAERQPVPPIRADGQDPPAAAEPAPQSETAPAAGEAAADLDLADPQATPLPPAPPSTGDPDSAGDPDATGAANEGATRPARDTSPGAAGDQTAALPQLPPAPDVPDLPAWRQFAIPFTPPQDRPLIAVVITGLGLNGPRTLQAIEQLPAEIGLSFSPYGRRTDEFMRTARAYGHEVLLDLPMEPASADDPGTLALVTGGGVDANMERLDLVLSRGRGYVGVVGQWGGRFVTDTNALEPVMLELGRRGLLYLDNRPLDAPRAARLAADLGVPTAINDRSLDARMAATPAVDASLAQVERIARERGTAVALANPNPTTLEELAAWVPTLAGKGLALAPITAVVDTQPVR
jgi:hypothetical protein